ncbi:DUF6282 family protein [Bartonella sp. WD12.1]|uniref:DUF6282 family protein n=1 Tax=Bartonella sp. WD12.1 TaxID=1933903 RepID=UPI0009998A2B|nr:DUF6282 family protein [Bartonella sp. WD12.1]OPB29454.1 hypothetical protein BWD121_004740 [Bartonella sp. WD12.1]
MSECFIQFWRKRLKFLDIHYHARPDLFDRAYSAYEVAQIYAQHRGGVVLKNHLGSTAALATVLQDQGLPVFGSIVLNNASGGLSLLAVRNALAHYQFDLKPKLLVHLPTIVPTHHQSRLKRNFSNDYAAFFAQQPTAITCERGRLRTEVYELITFAADNEIVLSSGHASKDATLRLLDAVAQKGNCTLLLNQPANPMTGFSAAQLQALGKHDWLYIEQCALTFYLGYQTKEDMLSVLSKVNNVIYSSDLGQLGGIDISTWLIDSANWFQEAKLSPIDIQAVTLDNPLKMLSPVS